MDLKSFEAYNLKVKFDFSFLEKHKRILLNTIAIASFFIFIIVVSLTVKQFFTKIPVNVQAPQINPFPQPTIFEKALIESEKEPISCVSFFENICTKLPQKDFSGDVGTTSQREANVLRLFEDTIRNNRDKTLAEIDEILANQIYTKERTNKIEKLFKHIKRLMIKFLILNNASKQIIKMLSEVSLELPPPANIYNDEPDLLTSDNAIFYPSEKAGKIRIGGAQVYGVSSRYNMAFTLAHELAHAVDPCLLREKNVPSPYSFFNDCIELNASQIEKSCDASTRIAEVFADWIATHIIAHMIELETKSQTTNQITKTIKNAVRDICPETPEDEIYEENSHPSSEERINKIFAKHPKIRGLLKCQDKTMQASKQKEILKVNCFFVDF